MSNSKNKFNILKAIIYFIENDLNKFFYWIILISVWIYVVRVHDYLTQFNVNFQWCMFILGIVWLFIPYSKKIKFFGNELELTEMNKKIEDLQKDNNLVVDLVKVQNQDIIKNYGTIFEECEFENQNNKLKEEYSSIIFGFNMTFDLKLLQIYLKNKSKFDLDRLDIIEIIFKLNELGYIDEEMKNIMCNTKVILNNIKIPNKQNYEYVKKYGKLILDKLDNIYDRL